MTTEVNTFSAVIDACLARSGRVDRRADIISFARMTIREIQVLGAFANDLVEDQLTSVTADPHVYVLPSTFRQMITVQYPGLVDERGNFIYAKYKPIGKGQNNAEHFWYRSGDSAIFVGHGGNAGSAKSINIAYLAFSRTFRYFETVADRPARYDDETESWVYAAAYDISDAQRQVARELVSNWVLFNWYDTVLEGTLAKLYKVVDDPRAVSSFAFFERAKKQVLAGEITSLGGDR